MYLVAARTRLSTVFSRMRLAVLVERKHYEAVSRHVMAGLVQAESFLVHAADSRQTL